jgi:hypothetical protein
MPIELDLRPRPVGPVEARAEIVVERLKNDQPFCGVALVGTQLGQVGCRAQGEELRALAISDGERLAVVLRRRRHVARDLAKVPLQTFKLSRVEALVGCRLCRQPVVHEAGGRLQLSTMQQDICRVC